jgi:hypothetical protein
MGAAPGGVPPPLRMFEFEFRICMSSGPVLPGGVAYSDPPPADELPLATPGIIM